MARRFKLVTNVSDLAFLRWFAYTRGRLVVSVAVGVAAMFGVGLWSANFVLNVSSSVGLNLLLITFNLGVALVVGYLQTILVGDLVFPGPWREQVVLGLTPTEGASVRDHSAEFMVLLFLLVASNAVLVNVSAGGFLGTYQEEGFYRSRLRSDDPAERVAALAYMTDPMNYRNWEHEGLRTMVLAHLDDPDVAVQSAAVWNTGRMNVTSGRAALAAIVADESRDDLVRSEAAEALGRLGLHDATRRSLEAVLLGCEQCSSRLQVGLLRGLGLMRSPLSIPVATKFSSSPDEQVALHAFWVLRNTGEVALRETILEQLEHVEAGSLRQCALLDTLKMVAIEEDVVWARRQFDRAAADAACEPVIWTERNERQHYILYSDSFREKYLKIVANAAGSAQRAWYERLVADPEQPYRIREVASEIMKQLDEASGRR